MKQRKAVEALGETGGVISKAMAKAGYAPSVVHATEKLTNSDGWKELMGKHLDDKKLAKIHEAGLKATFTDKFNNDAPDYAIRHKYLETAYKVKDKIKPDYSPPNNTQVNINFFSNPKVMEAAKQLDEAVKDYITNETKKPLETL